MKLFNVSDDGKVMYYWPYCEHCRQPFEFDPNEPFAHCECGTTEWGDPRPAFWIPQPGINPLGK